VGLSAEKPTPAAQSPPAANAIVALALGGAPRPGRLALTDRDSGAIVDRRSDRDALGVYHRHRRPPLRDPHP
jgi:hypothetical protein